MSRAPTYAEAVSREHVAYLKRSGMSYGQVVGQALDALEGVGLPPKPIATPFDAERAFADAFMRLQHHKIGRVA